MTALAKGQLSLFAFAVGFYVMTEFPVIAIPVIAALVMIAGVVILRQYELRFSLLHGQLVGHATLVIACLFHNSGLPEDIENWLTYSFFLAGSVVCLVSTFRPFPNPRP